MKTAIVSIVGESPYSQSRCYDQDVPRLPKELPAAYEERTWRNRMHITKDGSVMMPGTCFANCAKEAAKRLKLQVPGKGRVEYTKYFEAGIMCPNPLILPVKAEDVPAERLFVPSDGRRGGGKRVWKIFPRIDAWGGDVTFYVFDDIITEDIFRQVSVAAGLIVGLGRFRPQNCGFYGRFTVASIEWRDGLSAAA